MNAFLALCLLTGANERAEELLRQHDAKGAVMVLDVKTGAVVARAGRDAPVLPLSVIKLFLATIAWAHEMEVPAEDMLVMGRDRPGAELAIALRKKIGGAKVLAELRQLGLGVPPGSLTLDATADEETWGSCLSIGERHVTVTPTQISRFLREVAQNVRRLHAPMRDAVTRGTAHAVASRLDGTGWQLGGKTGSGPAPRSPLDGWFAGLIFERDQPRYTVAVFVEQKGPGGGVAASIAADLALFLARH